MVRTNKFVLLVLVGGAFLAISEMRESGSLPAWLDRVLLGLQHAEPAWMSRVRLVDEALEEGSVDQAVREWRESYRAALGSRQWAALAEVGDRALQIASAGGDADRFRPEAIQAYVEALRYARAERSAAGL